jgi:hypothetical protein
MTGDFKWFTDDETTWEVENRKDRESFVSFKPKSRFKFLSKKVIIVLLFLLITLSLGTRQILLRAQEVNEKIEADVLAARDFMLQAVLAKDPERFNLVLGEKDFQWQHLQRVSLRRDLLFDRAPFNLWFHEEALRQMLAENELGAQLVLAPDLRSAELTTSLPYYTQATDGLIESLFLKRTMNFDYDGRQWRHVPPMADDWGPMGNYLGKMITLDFPARDADISHFLAAALDKKFLALCDAEQAIDCSMTPIMHITFSTDIETLLSLSRPVQGSRFWRYRAHLNANDKFELSVPTPSLVGIPESQDDREVWLNGYSSWIITSFLTRKSPNLSFEKIAGILSDLDLELPPPVGYDPRQLLSTQPLPTEQALVSCYDQDQLTRKWAYDFSGNQWTLLDIDNCTNCEQIENLTTQIISADGRFAINTTGDSQSLLLSHVESGLIEKIDGASQPVWIDDKTFAFISYANKPFSNWDRPSLTAEPKVNIAKLVEVSGVYQVEVERSIMQQELLSAVPENRIINNLQLDAILPQEGRSETLFILTSNGFHEQFLFKIPLDGRDIILLSNWVDNGSTTHSFNATKNGRFLTVSRYNSRNTYLTLIDLNTTDREIMELAGRPVARYAWSENEQWLLVANDRLLRLFSPTDNIDLRIKHTHGDCTAINWAN